VVGHCVYPGSWGERRHEDVAARYFTDRPLLTGQPI
jgi:hypothetical protein